MKFNSKSQEDTEKFGGEIALKLADENNVFLLEGDLGAGKTAFARGFIRELTGDKNLVVTSPTFVLSNSYISKNGKEIRHLDLYRLTHPEESCELDIDAAFDDCIVLIEWSEIIKDILPEKTIKINFTRISENEREISVLD